MRITSRQTGVISYAGLDEKALWQGAQRAFAQADGDIPQRFRTFLPLFPAELIVNMSYVGKSRKASPAGFSVDPAEYHRKLSEERPDLYAGENRSRCFTLDGYFRGGVVTVDETWAAMFPQYAPFQGEKLMIHMIGQGHQAVAVPESIFPKGGGILAGIEHALGITNACGHYTAWVRERLSAGESYDPLRFEEEYLAQTGLSSVWIRQETLADCTQDASVMRSLQEKEEAISGTQMDEENAVAQYVPYRYACDFFVPETVTRQTVRLMQLYFEGDSFQSDLWMPYEDAVQYMNRRSMKLNVRALCEGFQIAPATDADTRGGCYPNRARVATIRDRSLRLLVSDVINNPAYGSGLNPMGRLNRRVCLPHSAALIQQGKLALEQHTITCGDTRVDEETLLRMRALAEWQEHKGRLIDAMYRRETALGQMQPGSLSYARARDILDARVQRLETLIKDAPVAHSQRSGYDADIEYLRRAALSRDGEPFARDEQREKTIAAGCAMRAQEKTFALADLKQKPVKENAARKEESARKQAGNGQWYEQINFFSAMPTLEEAPKET